MQYSSAGMVVPQATQEMRGQVRTSLQDALKTNPGAAGTINRVLNSPLLAPAQQPAPSSTQTTIGQQQPVGGGIPTNQISPLASPASSGGPLGIPTNQITPLAQLGMPQQGAPMQGQPMLSSLANPRSWWG